MGCSKSKPPKVYKDYSQHPDFIAFGQGDPQPDKKNPLAHKKMCIEPKYIPQCLKAAGISVAVEGRYVKEYNEMDPDYKGHVRFGEFKKFCKHARKGKAFSEVDSSYSDSSEQAEEITRELWKRIDENHDCEVPKGYVKNMYINNLHISASGADIVDYWDLNENGMITFKEFRRGWNSGPRRNIPLPLKF